MVSGSHQNLCRRAESFHISSFRPQMPIPVQKENIAPNAIGIQRRDSGPCFPLTSLLLGAWDQGTPSTHCSTVASGFALCQCRAERHHFACTLHSRNACAPSLTAFPNPCINIIYEGCLGQNGPCNHTFEMFFQAL